MTPETEPPMGDILPTLSKVLTQEKIDSYARASGDQNPLHTDPGFAGATRFGGTIAHGMLLLAYVSESLTAAFGEHWLSGGRLKARFRAPARPGQTVRVEGRVTSTAGGIRRCELECRNDAGETLITAEAEVPQ